jgi:signal transduction histidine kinase
MTQSLSRRIGGSGAALPFAGLALALWLLYAIRSRRRYRAAAHDRQRAVEAMEQAIVAKRKFLSMVNHEVRSPLQSIVASAELLAMKDSRPDSVGRDPPHPTRRDGASGAAARPAHHRAR